jgi:hypothetical protein
MSRRVAAYFEDALIILSICALWPKAFHFEGCYPDVLMWAALFTMAVVFFRRIRRLKRLVRVQDKERGRVGE